MNLEGCLLRPWAHAISRWTRRNPAPAPLPSRRTPASSKKQLYTFDTFRGVHLRKSRMQRAQALQLAIPVERARVCLLEGLSAHSFRERRFRRNGESADVSIRSGLNQIIRAKMLGSGT